MVPTVDHGQDLVPTVDHGQDLVHTVNHGQDLVPTVDHGQDLVVSMARQVLVVSMGAGSGGRPISVIYAHAPSIRLC